MSRLQVPAASTFSHPSPLSEALIRVPLVLLSVPQGPVNLSVYLATFFGDNFLRRSLKK